LLVLAAVSCACASGIEVHPAVHLGGAVPLGDFCDDGDMEANGYATFGFGGAFQINVLFLRSSVSVDWISDVSILVNAFEDTDAQAPYNVTLTSIDGGTYFNFPVLSGARVGYAVTPKFGVWSSGQIGASVLLERKMEATAFPAAGGTDAEMEFESTASFAFGLGAGVLLAERVSIGVRYANLGEPEIDYTVRVPSIDLSLDGEREFLIHVLQLMIGFQF